MSDRPAIRPQNDHAVGHKTKMGWIFRSNPLNLWRARRLRRVVNNICLERIKFA